MMIQHLLPLIQGLTIAQRDAWESLGNRFSGEHAKLNLGDLWALGGVILAGIALVLLLRWLYGLQQGRRLSCEPRHLFADLCSAHRLRRADRKWLRLLAEHHDLTSPGVLFVRPDLFNSENLPDEDERATEAYQRLKNKLFAGIEDEVVTPPQPAQPPADHSAPILMPPIATAIDVSVSDSVTA